MDSWVIILVLGLLAADAGLRFVLRAYFPPES